MTLPLADRLDDGEPSSGEADGATGIWRRAIYVGAIEFAPGRRGVLTARQKIDRQTLGMPTRRPACMRLR